VAAKALSTDDEGLESAPPWPQDAGIGAAEHGLFSGSDVYDLDRALAYVSSHSWVINAGPEERARILDAVRTAAPPGEFRMVESCTVWRGRRD